MTRHYRSLKASGALPHSQPEVSVDAIEREAVLQSGSDTIGLGN